MVLKEIPGTRGFLADEVGNIYTPEKVKRPTYRNGDGYITCSVLTDEDRWVTYGVARLVALAHLLHTRKPEHTQVNHRDNDLSNNRVMNLEWVTDSENNIHSEIMRQGNQYSTIVVWNEQDKPITMCLNAHVTAEMFGISPLDVWDSVRLATQVATSDGRIVRFSHQPWNRRKPIRQDQAEVARRYLQSARPMKVKDIDTAEVVEYPSINAVAKALGVSPSRVYRAAQKSDEVRLINKQYQVAYEGESFLAAAVEDLFEARQHGAREVCAYSYVLKKYVIYACAKEFYLSNNLSKKAVTTTLKKGKLRLIGDWVAVYYSIENVNRLRYFVEGPATT
jgi:hypothetical protein